MSESTVDVTVQTFSCSSVIDGQTTIFPKVNFPRHSPVSALRRRPRSAGLTGLADSARLGDSAAPADPLGAGDFSGAGDWLVVGDSDGLAVTAFGALDCSGAGRADAIAAPGPTRIAESIVATATMKTRIKEPRRARRFE
ncbi:hypothetical protein [Micromonospora pattaloongensis]|uniref:hypothetical protein n=1 Tax=Micromonospora pattaloongensis TaxID=405436 RepID=UPI0011152F47|nr:hypothetical protein [Micromonospora pattaloongensis]